MARMVELYEVSFDFHQRSTLNGRSL